LHFIEVKNNRPTLKGKVHLKMKMLSFLIHPQVVPNSFKECW